MSDQQEHTLDVTVGATSSIGYCAHPECGWEMKGNHADVLRVFDDYHEEGSDLALPPAVPVPPVPEHEYLQDIEKMIISYLVVHLRDGLEKALFVAYGVAYARAVWIQNNEVDRTQPGWLGAPDAFIAVMASKVGALSKRQQDKLAHPQRSRAAQQRILEGENS